MENDLITKIPTLTTNRLILRPFSMNDASEVQRLAGDFDVAKTTAHIPHPYENGMAEQWIASHPEELHQRGTITLAITRRDGNMFIGAIALTGTLRDSHTAEIGYWIGKPHWNQGYCTEAAVRLLTFGFQQLKLHRIFARHFKSNPASGRVMQKMGMIHEGCMRQHFKRWEHYEDVEFYGILRDEFILQL